MADFVCDGNAKRWKVIFVFIANDKIPNCPFCPKLPCKVITQLYYDIFKKICSYYPDRLQETNFSL